MDYLAAPKTDFLKYIRLTREDEIYELKGQGQEDAKKEFFDNLKLLEGHPTGHFCPALAKAVKTMKKSEKMHLVRMVCQLVEGGAVPPNATLDVELELVSWKNVSKIGDDKKMLTLMLKSLLNVFQNLWQLWNFRAEFLMDSMPSS